MSESFLRNWKVGRPSQRVLGHANVNTDLRIAEKLMVPAPPQTDLARQGIDPRRLRASFHRGMAAMQSNDSDATTNEGAGLVSLAAALGYEPARVTIVQEYPRSPIILSAVSSAEAVRYSLDPLFVSGSQGESNRFFLVLLASYFSGRHELPAYATDLCSVLTRSVLAAVKRRFKRLGSCLSGNVPVWLAANSRRDILRGMMSAG